MIASAIRVPGRAGLGAGRPSGAAPAVTGAGGQEQPGHISRQRRLTGCCLRRHQTIDGFALEQLSPSANAHSVSRFAGRAICRQAGLAQRRRRSGRLRRSAPSVAPGENVFQSNPAALIPVSDRPIGMGRKHAASIAPLCLRTITIKRSGRRCRLDRGRRASRLSANR
jgi:hypothetical protein